MIFSLLYGSMLSTLCVVPFFFVMLYVVSLPLCIAVAIATCVIFGFCLYRRPKATLITLATLFIGITLLGFVGGLWVNAKRNSPGQLEYCIKHIAPGMTAPEIDALISEELKYTTDFAPYRANTILNPAKPPVAYSKVYYSHIWGMQELRIHFDETNTVVGYLYQWGSEFPAEDKNAIELHGASF